METVQFIQTSPEQLAELIAKGINSKLQDFEERLANKHNDEDLITPEQACELLQIDRSTLWRWEKKGKVKIYGIGHRRYLKRAEILDSLILKK